MHSHWKQWSVAKFWSAIGVVLAAALLVLLAQIVVWPSRIGEWSSPISREVQRVDLTVPLSSQTVIQPEPMGIDSSESPIPRTLHLAAVQPGRGASIGYADLGVSILTPQRYSEGALLANGARLVEIHSDHVILEHDGVRKKLVLHELESQSGRSRADALLVGGRTGTVSIVDTHEPLTDLMRLNPVYAEDQLIGIDISPGASTATFRDLGLQRGDRITAIDGKKVADMTSAVAALREHTEIGRNVVITLSRGGKTQDIRLTRGL